MKRLLYVVIILNLLFLWNYHSAEFGGFLSFSESLYAVEAQQLEFTGIWKPVVPYTGRIDFNVPPMFVISQYLLHGGAQTPSNVRLLPILLNVLNIFLIYKIARILSGNETTGVIIGILYASTGITNILAITAIPETMFVTWLLLAYFFHIRGEYHFSFLALAFGIFTKQPAAILGIILFIDFYRKEKHLRWIAPGALFVMFSLLAMFYFVHIATGSIDDIIYNIGDRAGVARVPGVGQLAAMLLEVAYATGFIGLLILLSTRLNLNSIKNDLLTQIFLAYSVFFLFYHHHSYYMFPAVVFGLLQVSRLYHPELLMLFAGLLILTIPITVDLVVSNRGYDPGFSTLECRDYVASDDFVSYYWPVFKYYCPENDLYTCDEWDLSTSLEFSDSSSWSNPNFFKPSKEQQRLVYGDGCPVNDSVPTFKWSGY